MSCFTADGIPAVTSPVRLTHRVRQVILRNLSSTEIRLDAPAHLSLICLLPHGTLDLEVRRSDNFWGLLGDNWMQTDRVADSFGPRSRRRRRGGTRLIQAARGSVCSLSGSLTAVLALLLLLLVLFIRDGYRWLLGKI